MLHPSALAEMVCVSSECFSITAHVYTTVGYIAHVYVWVSKLVSVLVCVS